LAHDPEKHAFGLDPWVASEKILRKQTFSADFTVLKRFRML